MTKPQLDAGASRLLAGRYQLLEELASGGMASVWRGHDQVLGRNVAIKILREDLAADAQFATRFRQEAVHAASLNHAGIVGVFDIGAHDGVPYIVMELVDGRTIRQLIAREGPLPPAQAARIALGVAQSLAYAHRLGVVHHNLKPGNIILMPSGAVKVADFSLSRAVDGEDPEQTGEILGHSHSHGYLAPEQVSGDTADARADIYALGACLFEMLTGRSPAEASTRSRDGSVPPPRALRAGIPRGLDEAVRKAMAPNPADRFADAQELVTVLKGLADRRPLPQPIPAPPPPPRQQTTTLPPPSDRGLPQPGPAGGSEPRTMVPVSPAPSRSRWLGPLIAVVVVVAAIVVLVNFNGVRPRGGTAVGNTNAPETTAAPEPVTLDVRATGSINPLEAGGEKADLVELATDGNRGTAWTSQDYRRNAEFGNLKAGVGLILRADGDAPARELELVLGQAGGSAKVFAADEPFGDGQRIDPVKPAAALEARLAELGWEEVSPVKDLDERTSFELSGGPSRFYLLWITSLPQVGPDSFQLAVHEARLLS